ncbi:PQQ-binding-like beta-propeller repeat protein [Rhodococcus ruber]|uniref:PQQ-binding-like beta-propeller repeat protein n=1 Tax=Rhodococcus ruber TaxID=1830 RepID=A0ABT4M862_9NOCA|nr:PQQ-binding-like beta-propeller repeat protein [Rhodococcus ruber]MCZ4517121.1 PQQ-binding-like beta-propeller repeat protein [Rhodococcus ruber]
MELTRNERWKLIALGSALVVGAAFIAVQIATNRSDTPVPGVEQAVVGASLDTPPKPAWTADVRTLSDNGGDVLLSMPYGLGHYYGYGGFLSGDDVMIGATGYPLPSADPSSGAEVGAVTLIGVNPDTGAPLWKTPIGRVSQCAPELESVLLACWGDRRVVSIDTSDGALVADVGTDFDVNGARIVDETVFVSGDLDGTPVLTKGSPTAIESDFRRTFERSADFSSVYVMPDLRSVMLMYRGDGTPQYVYRVFDLDSGSERFTFEGDSLQGVGNGLFLSSIGSESGTVGTQNLLAADGSVVGAIPRPSYGASMYPSAPTGPLPMFLGDGAYDPDTGEELWRNPAMVRSEFSGTQSAMVAVVGRVVIVADPEAKTLTGLDIDDGTESWVTPWEDAYWVRGGLTDGKNFVFGDYQGTHSIDADTGEIGWTIPQPEGVDPARVVVSTAAGHMTRSWDNQFTVYR